MRTKPRVATIVLMMVVISTLVAIYAFKADAQEKRQVGLADINAANLEFHHQAVFVMSEKERSQKTEYATIEMELSQFGVQSLLDVNRLAGIDPLKIVYFTPEAISSMPDEELLKLYHQGVAIVALDTPFSAVNRILNIDTGMKDMLPSYFEDENYTVVTAVYDETAIFHDNGIRGEGRWVYHDFVPTDKWVYFVISMVEGHLQQTESFISEA